MAQAPFSFLFTPSEGLEAQLRGLYQVPAPAAIYAAPSQDVEDENKVVHDYKDHAEDTDGELLFHHMMRPLKVGSNGASVEQAFPVKLHYMLNDLECDKLSHIASWQPHGRCFVVHDARLFKEFVLTNYFRQTKLASFQRQLNIYGFKRLTTGPDKGGYYHELFLRGRPWLAHSIKRIKLKGTGTRKASSPDTEPKFYNMKFLPPNKPKNTDTRSALSLGTQRSPDLSCPGRGGGMVLQNMVPSLLAPTPTYQRTAAPSPLQQQLQLLQLQQQLQHHQQLQHSNALSRSVGDPTTITAQEVSRELLLAAVNNAPLPMFSQSNGAALWSFR